MHFRPTISLLALLTIAGLVMAQEGSAPARGSGKAGQGAKAKAKQQPITVTPEREAAVMTFVERNHAEVGELLKHLKEIQPAAYEQAVKDIFRQTERLAGVKERDPAQYELEIVVWKAQSRVQLIAAKMKMNVTEDLQKDLRLALGTQADARLALLKHERQKASDRLTKLDGDIERQARDREKLIDRQFQTLTKAGGKPGAKVAAKANGKKTAPTKIDPAKTVPTP